MSVEVIETIPPKSGKLVLKQLDGSNVSLESVNFSDNIGVAGYKIYLDGQEIADVDARDSGQLYYKYEKANLAGKLNFSVEAYDEAGNVSKKVKSSITIKDVTAPDKVEGLKADDGADETKTILRWNAPEDNVGVASYEIYIDGKKYTSKTNSLTVKKLRAGDNHTFTVIALDKAKNRSVESSGQGFSVADVTGPKSGKLVLKQLDGSNVSLESVNFSDNIGVAGYKIYLDGQEIADVAAGESGQLYYEYEKANLAGKLNFSVDAYDEAGNVSKKVKSSITIKDVTAPDKVEGLYAEDGADETKTILRWNAPEDNVGVASYEIYIDGKKYTSKTNSLTVKKLRAGDDHTFTVIALDKAKNRSVESSGQGFSVADVTGPKSGKLVLKQRDGSTVSLESVNFSDNVGVAGYKIYLDGQEIADVDAGESGQLNYMYENANLSGKLNFSVAAYDEAGNISKTVKSSIKIKNIAAPVMLTGLVADGIDETATTFSRDIPADAVSNISKGVDVVRDWDDAWSVDDAMELTEFHNWGDGNIDAYMLGKEWTDENAVHLSANTVDWYKFKVDASDETGSAWKNGSLEIEMESDSDCSGSVTVELLDASGKVLSAKLFSACGEEEINLSSYAAGEYFIKVSASENFAGYGHLSIGYGC